MKTLTKTEEEESIIINRSARSTYPKRKSVSRGGATPKRHQVALLGARKCLSDQVVSCGNSWPAWTFNPMVKLPGLH